MIPSPLGDCVGIEWERVRTEQTAEFQSFRMRTFKVRGRCPCHVKVKSFMVLKFLSLTVQRLRPKALLLVCLFRLSELAPLFSIVKRSLEGESGGDSGGRKEGLSDESMSRVPNKE
jgi:hypothetical protein